MKTFTLILAIFVSLVFAAVDAPGSITLIRPDPKTRVPQGTNLTFGFASPDQQLYGLLQNVRMSHTQPDGTNVPGPTFGPSFTEGGSFQSEGYTPAECRTFPGVSTTSQINASQVGNYTFFWNITYVMSADSTKANDTFCGPPPFSRQNWNVNSTVRVIEVNVGTAVAAATATTTSALPSKPTGKVNNAVGIKGSVLNLGSTLGLLAGLAMMV